MQRPTEQTEQDKSGRGRWLVFWIMGGVLGIVLLLGSVTDSAVYGQAEAPAAASGVDGVTPDEVNAVAREIWCPLCSGVRLDACELKACAQMKDVIAIKLSEGEDTESIKAYFVEQYGPQVMGEPPRSGFNWLAWILPVVALLVGGYIFWHTTQRMMQPATPLGAELGTELGEGLARDPAPPAGNPRMAVTAPNQNAGTSSTVSTVSNTDDEYQQKLDEELAKYG